MASLRILDLLLCSDYMIEIKGECKRLLNEDVERKKLNLSKGSKNFAKTSRC